MKMPSKRPKTYIERASTITMKSEGTTPYAHFRSVEESIKDLILGWHKYNGTNWAAITTPSNYAAYLKTRGYYGDDISNYQAGLTSINKGLTVA